MMKRPGHAMSLGLWWSYLMFHKIWKICLFMYLLLKMVIFYSYVSLPKGITTCLGIGGPNGYNSRLSDICCSQLSREPQLSLSKGSGIHSKSAFHHRVSGFSGDAQYLYILYLYIYIVEQCYTCLRCRFILEPVNGLGISNDSLW